MTRDHDSFLPGDLVRLKDDYYTDRDMRGLGIIVSARNEDGRADVLILWSGAKAPERIEELGCTVLVNLR